MTMGVYKIIHTPTGVYYVGSSIDLERRLLQWKLALASKKPGIKIKTKIWHKYKPTLNSKIIEFMNGPYFSLEWKYYILWETNEIKELERLEKYEIQKALSKDPILCLNMTDRTERY